MRTLEYDCIESQTSELIRIVKLNSNLKELLRKIKLPKNMCWYLVAGCINQTIWNHLTKRKITYGIGDYDLVYWNLDISKKVEEKIQKSINKKFSHLNTMIEAINQARVHTWFKKDYGVDMKPYKNLESAIASWPSTVTCVGVTNANGKIKVYAPYGLSDIFGMKLRYNPSTIVPAHLVKKKIDKWLAKWPELVVVRGSFPTNT